MTRVAVVALHCGILTQGLPLFILAGMAWELRRPPGWKRLRSAMRFVVQRVRQAISSVALRVFGERGRRRFQRFRLSGAGRKPLLTILALLAIPLLIGLWRTARNRGEPASNSAAEIALSAAEPSAEANRESSGERPVVVVQSDDLKWDRLVSRRQRMGLAILGAFSLTIVLLLALRGLLTAREANGAAARP